MTPGIKKSKIHEIEHTLDNLGEKCEEWLPKALKLDETCLSANFAVLDKSSSLPLRAEKLVLDTKQKLSRYENKSDIVSKNIFLI